jgi:F-type H+-transporting ATPase subunit delta
MDNANPNDDSSFRHTAGLEEQRIGHVYAQALLNAAEGAGEVEAIKAELHELVQGVFRLEPRFEEFLTSSAIGRDQKALLLRKTLEGQASKLLLNFLLILNSHDRLPILRTVRQEFIDLDNRRNRRLPVLVRTAVPLSDGQRDRLLEDLRTGFKLEPVLETRIDADLLGGMILQVGDLVMDASVRGELDNLQKQLLARSSHEIQSGRDRFSHTA